MMASSVLLVGLIFAKAGYEAYNIHAMVKRVQRGDVDSVFSVPENGSSEWYLFQEISSTLNSMFDPKSYTQEGRQKNKERSLFLLRQFLHTEDIKNVFSSIKNRIKNTWNGIKDAILRLIKKENNSSNSKEVQIIDEWVMNNDPIPVLDDNQWNEYTGFLEKYYQEEQIINAHLDLPIPEYLTEEELNNIALEKIHQQFPQLDNEILELLRNNYLSQQNLLNNNSEHTTHPLKETISSLKIPKRAIECLCQNPTKKNKFN